MFDLRGRTALITGASRGLGAAIAVGLARWGADVIGVSTSITADSPVAAAVEAQGRRFTAVSVDLSDRASVDELLEELDEVHPPIDLCVNNAGVVHSYEAAELPLASWDEVLETNVTSAFRVAQHCGRSMAARQGGKIVFLASMLSYQGGYGVASYAASKSAVLGLTRALSNEWAGRGVNVNAVAPGYIVTDNTAALRQDPEEMARISARIPAGRWGQPEDVVGAVAFLCSTAADYVHGICLPVDGGWLGS